MILRFCKGCRQSNSKVRFPSSTAPRCTDCTNLHNQERAERLAILRPSPIAAEPVREADPDRNAAHRAWVRSQPCAVHGLSCKGIKVAHHDRTGQTGGTGIKPPDDRAICLCDGLHRVGHPIGWKTFEAHYGVNLSAEADRLARLSPY